MLSFDHVLAGPFGMMMLADLGAEVLKVESSKGGLDPFRFFGTGDDPNASPRFLEFNRNKRSIAVNLKHPEGPGLIRELAKHCDLVLDNFRGAGDARPGTRLRATWWSTSPTSSPSACPGSAPPVPGRTP